MSSYEWPPQGSGGGGGGVTTLNGLSGDLTLVAGTNITITPSGSNLTINSTGGSGANVTLSNLTNPTAVNQDLIFNKSAPFIQTPLSSIAVATEPLTLQTGDNNGSANTGNLLLKSGDFLGGTASRHTGTVILASGANNGINVGSRSGNVTISSGAMTGTAAGATGLLFLETGGSQFGPTGDINILTGTPDQSAATTHASGAIQIVTGSPASSTGLGPSGAATLQTGNTNSGIAGNVLLQGGNTTSGKGGDIVATAGGGSSTSHAGTIQLIGGTTDDGIVNELLIQGSTKNGNLAIAGNTHIIGGPTIGTSSRGGDSVIEGGTSPNGTAGDVMLKGGVGPALAITGNVKVNAVNLDLLGTTKAINFVDLIFGVAPATIKNPIGQLDIIEGADTVAGALNLTTADQTTTTNSDTITLKTGNTNNSATPGNIQFNLGVDSVSTLQGSFNINEFQIYPAQFSTLGESVSMQFLTTFGQGINITAGDNSSANGDGGGVFISGGTATNGDAIGGEIGLTAGNGVGTGNGGDILIQPGVSSGSGTQGVVQLFGRQLVLSGNTPVTGITSLSNVSGTNTNFGVDALIGGTVTVSNTKVTANSRIFLTSQVDGGTPGFLRITAKTPGVSFVITSSSVTDASSVAWWIVEAQ